MTRFVYVSCGNDRTIRIHTLAAGGTLGSIATVSIPGTDQPSGSTPMAVHPNRRLLYVALRTPPYPVTSFAIDQSTGGLTPVATAPLPDSMAYLATDPTGRWLLSASYPGAVVAISPIDRDGAIRTAATQVIATPPKAHCIRHAPSGEWVYATTLGGDAILRWHFHNGHLDETSLRSTPLRTGAGPRHLEFGPSGTVFCLNELDATLDVLKEEAGDLVHHQTVPLLSGKNKCAAADLHITPDGTLLYASERTSNTLHAIRVQQGTVSRLTATRCEATPRGFAIDPDGRFLLCAGQTDNAIGIYAIDSATGGLMRRARHATGPNPNWIEIIDL